MGTRSRAARILLSALLPGIYPAVNKAMGDDGLLKNGDALPGGPDEHVHLVLEPFPGDAAAPVQQAALLASPGGAGLPGYFDQHAAQSLL